MTEHAPAAEGADLRVLVVHNRYRSALPSGENDVVDRDIEMLRDAGVQVSTWIRESDDIDTMGIREKMGLPLRPIWSHRDTRAVADIIERDRPQILHLHNPYPLISPAVIRTAKRRGVKVVQTVHNYRHSCLNGLHLRDGKVCTLCVGKRFATPGVRYGCYRDSKAQSVIVATAEALHHPTWKQVDRFFALSEFMARQLVQSGIARHKVVVRPNFVDDPGPPTPPGEGFLFAGRLDEAKGIRLLLDAWELSGLDGKVSLVIAGDGPLREEVEHRAASFQSVEVAGRLGREEMSKRFRACAVVVVPSVWFEGLPTVVLEAFAHGRMVIATRIGSLEAIGLSAPGWIAGADPVSLGRVLAEVSDHSVDAEVARAEFRTHYSRDVARDCLLRLYGGE